MNIPLIKIHDKTVQRVVAIVLLEMAGMTVAGEMREIARDTESRKVFFLVADVIAKKLWEEMQNMGGSVSG